VRFISHNENSRDLGHDRNFFSMARVAPTVGWGKETTKQAWGTRIYDRRGYNPEKSASFFATYY
jgi:hypothetical protein